MADLFKEMRYLDSLVQGLSGEQMAMLRQIMEARPDAKFTVQTPGTEPKLNGITIADISALVADIPEGQPTPTKREIIENLGGNPKSSRDQGKVAKLLPNVPEIEMIPGKKAQMLKRLTDMRDDNDKDNDKE